MRGLEIFTCANQSQNRREIVRPLETIGTREQWAKTMGPQHNGRTFFAFIIILERVEDTR